MKRLLYLIVFMTSVLLVMCTNQAIVQASTVEQVPLLPAYGPIQIKAGDSLTFTRTNNSYNNISYIERFTHAEQYGTNPFWGFSTSNDGHYVHYNGTQKRLEGGTWNSHAFNQPFFDEWVTWTFEGNVGTLTFLQDWPYEVKNLYRNTLPTDKQSGWFNTTSIATYAVLNIHTQGSSLPGETTTPPNGVTLSGNTFADMIYFNDASNSGVTSYPAVYVATSTGHTFDTNILTDNLVFVVSQPNIKFFLGFSTGAAILSGIGDYVIYKDESNIYLKKMIGDVQQNQVHVSLSDFSFILIQTTPVVNPETWTVTFNTNGGSAVTNQTVNHNELAIEPNNPIRAGYNFEGWKQNDTLFDFNTPITQNVTLIAHWLAIDPLLITVTFNSNGGTQIPTIQQQPGELVVEPNAPTRPGFIFMGWYTNANYTNIYTFNTQQETDITLYAKWLPLSSGGDSIIDEQPDVSIWIYVGVAAVLIIGLFSLPKTKKGNRR